MIVQKCTPTTAFAPLSTCTPPLLPFRDAGYGPATYHITIPDILAGLYKALHLGIIDIDGVDAEEYEYFEKVENGDLNWVTARFIALACPREDIKGGSGSVGATMYQQQIQVQQQQQQQLTQYTTTTSLFSRIVASTTSSSPAPPPSSSTHMSRGGRVPLTPAYRMDDLIKHLKGKGVTTIVRLNNKTYDKSKFIDAGLEHVDLYVLLIFFYMLRGGGGEGCCCFFGFFCCVLCCGFCFRFLFPTSTMKTHPTAPKPFFFKTKK